ncbi:MAG: MiaB/RimO family radical SAM methylthiotransferase [Kiritimatiellae bacterium]|nr:MiaB/RimO family radical SAM methylthiotransferase [Kiritimatiellia bacterium]
MRTVSFKSFGCRLNRAETDRYAAEFARAGIAIVPFGTASDIVVIHTCAVTATAERECLRIAGSMRRKNPNTLLVLSGCAVESASLERLASLSMDLIVPRAQSERLVPLVLEKLPAVEKFNVSLAEGDLFQQNRHRALLKVQDGCSNFCTYCFVPLARGKPRSRSFQECLDEAREWIDKGFEELVVVGCNLALYEDGSKQLPELLVALTELDGVGRIRLSSLEPGRYERDVAQIMTEVPKLCAFLHLPIQSGDDDVLRRMGRYYDASYLRKSLDEIVQYVPNIGLGADLITGFPGETEAMFRHTKELVESYPFSNLHVFPYSERPGTPATSFPDQVPVATRKRRAAELIALRETKREAFAARQVGRVVAPLVESVADDGTGHGWTAEYLPCTISDAGRDSIGKILQMRVTSVSGEELHGSRGDR